MLSEYKSEKYREIFYLYHKEKEECDFLAFNRNKLREIIQVCHELTPDNLDREVKGITEAMRHFDFHQGNIVTYAQKDKITQNGLEIEVMPAYEFLGHF